MTDLTHDYPGWVLKRARDMRARAIIPLLPRGEDAHAPCAFLLELDDNHLELHIAEDGHAGVEAAMLTFSRRGAADFLGRFVGALSGRHSWTKVLSQNSATAP